MSPVGTGMMVLVVCYASASTFCFCTVSLFDRELCNLHFDEVRHTSSSIESPGELREDHGF